MDEIAERGIASHWAYKENNANDVSKLMKNVMEQKLQFYRSLIELQKEEINSNLKFIEEDAGITLADIVYFVSKEPIKSLGSLCSLKTIANLLSGNYCFDSYFYNIDDGTSRINDNTLEKVKQSPEKWALVLFDYHI